EFDQGVKNSEIALLHSDFEGLHVEPVAREHALGIAPLGIGRRPPSPDLRLVDDVIVDQGCSVNDFDHSAELYRTSALIVEELRGKQKQRRTYALATTSAK